MIMTTYQSNTASGSLGNVSISGWAKRLGATASLVLKSMETGVKASHDYKRLSTRLSPQQASKLVYQKYFDKNHNLSSR
jgi:hypothetical protein